MTTNVQPMIMNVWPMSTNVEPMTTNLQDVHAGRACRMCIQDVHDVQDVSVCYLLFAVCCVLFASGGCPGAGGPQGVPDRDNLRERSTDRHPISMHANPSTCVFLIWQFLFF